jgi:hypothetical protein
MVSRFITGQPRAKDISRTPIVANASSSYVAGNLTYNFAAPIPRG